MVARGLFLRCRNGTGRFRKRLSKRMADRRGDSQRFHGRELDKSRRRKPSNVWEREFPYQPKKYLTKRQPDDD